ncbi:arylsulfatase A-like enzyme [Kribbella sp. VKM Ac-2527]|uniref:Arylsulfatase A-like enzyme n=1 Tax=Kribbella caucasensis TaxID=2512215 RepID=A0A4R6KEL8_9ACTN|nr:arylsulfatase [Kribbella sp. VKM Ac-2527]TDO48455.1 arylsulfatase A-like enzyme [Kribbella sp. VKM Ac-2527]
MTRRNVILICVDEWRGDALSCAGHPYVETPHLDELARNGVRFSHAYSATPTCVPARVALFTGQSQEAHGRVGYEDGVPFEVAHPITVQGEFKRAGYHTQAIGKMHVWPERARLGFDDVILHDGFLHHSRKSYRQQFAFFDDYVPWLRRQPGVGPDAEYYDHGVNCNSVVARPWDKPEHLHPTHWLGTQTVDWLYRRDPTKPFFLYLSFHRPHPPYDPPQWAFDQYADLPAYQQVLGNWEDDWDEFRRDGDYQAAIGDLPNRVVHRARAGYYGLMAQLDLQVNRIREALVDFGVYDDTVIAFTSDHGEMMGDHRMFRKAVPYEGSARVPFIVAGAAADQTVARGRVVDQVVELRDLMPTLLDLAGLPIPSSVDGKSLAAYVRGEEPAEPVREWLHGEHVYWGQSLQWVTDGLIKYVWGSAKGVEQFFDLEADPGELHNLAGDPEAAALLRLWRGRLIQSLTGREEGFVVDGELVTGRPVTTILAHTRERIAAGPAD